MTNALVTRSEAPPRSPLALVALGVWLARRGVLAWISLAIAALTVVGLVVLGFVLAARGRTSPIHDVPILASSSLAWGGGFLLAFSAAAHALRHDREAGVRRPVGAPELAMRDYLTLRVGGLGALLFLVVGGGTLLVGLVVTAMAAPFGAAAKTLATTLASLAFAFGFAAVTGPMALAALGARSRVGGYAFLVMVLVLPEVVATSLRATMPTALAEVLSVPSALATLRASLLPGAFDGGRVANAVLSVGLFAGLTTWLVARAAAVVHREGDVP